MQACIDENEEMVTLLLEEGANIEARDNEGWTPLHAAVSAGNVDIAKWGFYWLVDHYLLNAQTVRFAQCFQERSSSNTVLFFNVVLLQVESTIMNKEVENG